MLFWDVEVSGPGPVVSGAYVMGEPWLVLSTGQTASVKHVGRWATLPSGGSGGVVDTSYVGPITPSNSEYRHGTMLNPRGGGTLHLVGGSDWLRPSRLGYDSRVGVFVDQVLATTVPFFDPALYLPINDPAFPGLPVVAGDVVVSTVSNDDQHCNNCAGVNRWTDIIATFNGDPCTTSGSPAGPSCSLCPTQWAAALSVLDAAPPAGAFRRPVAMASPSARLLLPHLTTAMVDWSQLPRLAWPVPSANCANPDPTFGCFPTAAMLRPMLSGLWLDHVSGETAEERVNPSMHIPGYGKETKRVIGSAACIMALNPDGLAAGTVSTSPPINSDFLGLAYGMLQAGLDVYGLWIDPTHDFDGVGGKVGGRKILLALAYKMFGSNGWSSMDGYLGAVPPNGPPRWTTWRTEGGASVAFERFQEDQQFYRAADPLQGILGQRVGWDWAGSPWKWSANRADGSRAYQAENPAVWPIRATDPLDPLAPFFAAAIHVDGPEAKRPDSSSAYASTGIALRLLQMESIWENYGLADAQGMHVDNEPLHALFGYLDRWMVPHNQYAAAGLHGPVPALTMESRKVNEFNLNNGYKNNPTLPMELWNQYRAHPTAQPAVDLLPNSFTFDDDVDGCSQLRSPTLVCQFAPKASKKLLVEMYASETYTPPTAWASVIMTASPSSPWPFTLGGNSVLVYLDPANLVSDFRQTNQYGYLGEVLPLPAVPPGFQFAIQCLFADIGGSGCVAASNAIVLTVQP